MVIYLYKEQTVRSNACLLSFGVSAEECLFMPVRSSASGTTCATTSSIMPKEDKPIESTYLGTR
ncbi:MAG TPA: hypothetical protein PKW73_01530 [Candidatus Obscuribacter sp.]|nr:hypothetical protein [Candidatus Obscuribacter sp.]